MKTLLTIILTCLSLLTDLHASSKQVSSTRKMATFDIFPASRRLNNSVYLIGNEYNHITFLFSARKHLIGKYKLQLPQTFAKPVTLTVDYPQSVTVKGFIGNNHQPLAEQQSVVDHQGIKYNRYKVSLPLDGVKGLKNRLIKHNYTSSMTSYIIPPAKLDAQVYWQLNYGEQILVKASTQLLTVGTIARSAKLPKQFCSMFSGGANLWSFPNGKFEILAKLYARLGITDIDVLYSPGELGTKKINYCRALKKYGIKVTALRLGSFMEYSNSKPEQYGSRGLFWAVNHEAKMINMPKERTALKQFAPFVDKMVFDYETKSGPYHVPGYNDQPTIKAFAEKYQIKEPLTPKLLKTKYKALYYRYRMSLFVEPIKAYRKLVNSVKPMPILVEQGSGLGIHIDYKLYDKIIDYHCPMIYTKSLINYYTIIANMKKYLNNDKIIPVTSYGYEDANGGVTLRQTPKDVILDVVATAAAGAVGHRIWPGLRSLDEGMLYATYLGLQQVAWAEDFYNNGQVVTAIKIVGLPYKTQKLKIGQKEVELAEPNWQTILRPLCHRLGDKYLITILNFSKDETCYTQISGKELAGKYLINPVTKNYVTVDDSGVVLVRTASNSPSLWLSVDDAKKLSNFTPLSQATLSAAFARKKEEFKTANSNNFAIGNQGDITINYNNLIIGDDAIVCLMIKTPKQQISLANSGGRIFDWTVDGKNIVSRKNLQQSGLAMDLLWLPSPARWSGDEIQNMTMKSCKNDGKTATIVYSGTFKNGLPGVRIEKTFQIKADNKTITVTIKLFNDTALPVTLSYWSHNTLNFANKKFWYLKNGKTLKVATPSGTTIFPAQGLTATAKKLVYSKKNIVDRIAAIYAEPMIESNNALVIQMPENFMNVYRYPGGSEWMLCPITLAAAGGSEFRFSYTITNQQQASKLENLKILK